MSMVDPMLAYLTQNIRDKSPGVKKVKCSCYGQTRPCSLCWGERWVEVPFNRRQLKERVEENGTEQQKPAV